MAHKFATLLRFAILILSISIANGLSVEERLQQLSDQLIEVKQVLKTNAAQLEIKDARLEVLEQKVARLEFALQNDREINSKSVLKYVDAIYTRKSSGKSGSIHRTCREAGLADPSLTSGMHWIDPDGQGVGDDPIYVYCDMITGSTSIPHDSEAPMNVGHCADPGCYSRAINYNATKRQMAALVELSGECHQSFTYDCFYAPLELNGVVYSWWNDKEGNAQYFWAGSNSSVHTCQCGIDGNCIDPAVNCNCDAAAPLQSADNGVITSKEILPITRLNFGRTQLQTSSGVHTLGRFKCTGQVAVTGMPRSCEDLWRNGYTLSGFHSVMGAKMVESVYCNFDKLPDDSGFQTWIGYENVKSLPTYFYVQRTENGFNQTNVPIPFDIERLNVGGAMNLTSGKFTAPRAGTYFLSASGPVGFPSTTSSNRLACGIHMHKNGEVIGYSPTDSTDTVWNLETVAIQVTVHLQTGDEIWLVITPSTSPGVSLYGYGSFHFTGFLLEEETFYSDKIMGVN